MIVRILVGVARLIGLILRGCLRALVRLLRTRFGRLVLLALVLYLGIQSYRAPALRIGTYNIRTLGPQTDLARLRAIIAEANPDILAVQEITDGATLAQLAAGLSGATQRAYRAVMSNCGGQGPQHVGFLDDEKKVQLDELREFPELRDDGQGRCSTGGRAGLLGIFSARAGLRRVRTHLLTVHFPAWHGRDRVDLRQSFWAQALQIAAKLREGGNKRVIILGDVNSTDYLTDQYGERRLIHQQVEQAGLQLLTSDVGCTEYWNRRGSWYFEPSHLDHIVTAPEIKPLGAPSVHGHCAALRCQVARQMPSDYQAVSDHCPVTIDIR